MSHLNHHQAPLCIVQGCPNSQQSNPSIQYFAVPAHIANIANAWYKNTMRTDLRASHAHHVCEQHFEESCFDYVGDGTKVLKPKSFPTLFDLEVFYKMIAYQESNKTIKKTNITFHTSNPEIDGKTLEPILKLNSASDHVKTRLAPTTASTNAQQQQEERENNPTTTLVNKPSADHFENKASNRCHVEGCVHNYVARRHRVQLYKISRDAAIARKWLDACGYENVPVSPSTATFKVCREHFTSNDFDGPATLRYDAVPSLFTTYSRQMMNKQNPSASNKRFRPDPAALRAQQAAAFNAKQRSTFPYRNSQSLVRNDDEEQNSVVSLSPMTEQIDESLISIFADNSKTTNDVDLMMNCADDQLSEAQLSHRPVKALDRTDNNNGMIPKARNPVGRPRIHPRHPPVVTPTRRSTVTDDDIEEIDEWNNERKRDREFVNGQYEDRLAWSKKSTANVLSSSYQRNPPPPPPPRMNHFVRGQTNNKIVAPPTNFSSVVPRPKQPNARNRGLDEGTEIELEQSYKRTLSKYYGQKPGRNCPLSDYGDFRARCPVCDDVILENNIQLIIHLHQHFANQSNAKMNPSPFEQINTKCSFCHSEFSNPYFLAIHIDDKHIGELNEYSCRICEEHHTSLSDLMKHLNVYHSPLDMPYTCEICQFRTSIYADMIYHFDEIHKGTRFFLCTHCYQTIDLPLSNVNSSTFLNGTSAYKHLSLHYHHQSNDERTIQSKYQHCRKCLLHVPSMKEHLQRDHSNTALHHQHHHEFYDDSVMDTSSSSRLVTATKSG